AREVPPDLAAPLSNVLDSMTDPARVLVLLELLERAWPVVLQKPRQRAISQQSALGLTARAVVAFVLGVTNALHRRRTDGAGRPIAAVHGHLGPERRDALGEGVARLRAQPVGPLDERRADRAAQSLDLFGCQSLSQPQRREPGAVQDLV